MLKNWREVEIPEKKSVFQKGDIVGNAKYFGISLGIGFVFLVIWDMIIPYLPRLTHHEGFDLNGNAGMYILSMVAFLLPWAVSGIIFHKHSCPAYGFWSMAGFFIAGVAYTPFNWFIALFFMYISALLFLANAPSQGDYTLQNKHLIYNFVLGMVACWINLEIMAYSRDIWTYMMFIQLHLFVTITIGLKIKQWGYFYAYGWAVFAFIAMFTFNRDMYFLFAIYSFFTPFLIAMAAMQYFHKIYTPMKQNKSL